MSYCRFIEADAYIYDDVYHGLYCCACSLMPVRKADMSIFLGEEDDGEWLINESFAAGYDYDKMLAHITEHRAAGHFIPLDVDERLRFERDCEHNFVDMDFGTRCDICWSPLNE